MKTPFKMIPFQGRHSWIFSGVTFDIGRAKELGMMHLPYSILELFWAPPSWKIRAKGGSEVFPPLEEEQSPVPQPMDLDHLVQVDFYIFADMQGNSFSVPQQSSLKYSRCFEKKRPNP